MALEVVARADAPIPLHVSFRAEPGELLALVGHSGSGKTTLLRTIAGLWRPQSARVSVDGEVWLDTAAGINLAPHRRHAGLVFQNYALFPHMTAAQNVMAAMDRRTPNLRDEAERLLALVNLPGLADRKPGQLSGGQQQRVAVARALARRPQVLLLDEPFSAVDRATRERLHDEIIALRAHLKMPVVLVTHDMNEAQLLADRMVVIERGGVVREGTTAEVMTDPVALRTMGIREVAANLPAVIVEQEDDGLTRLQASAGPLFLPRVEAPVGTRLTIRIPAQDVILSRTRPEGLSALNVLPATVTAVRLGEGPGAIIQLRAGEDLLLARITRRSALALELAPGVACFAILKTVAVAQTNVGVAR
ncbi:MAG: molybdenum ABC transporter ATP-binding protein [Hoeflea sp.]|uniref:molybdenum ABC transporter ATP-binding protein n=1 Tax=Hoeflea sp. TaxID=1940281 RepID=UPI001D6ECCC4|nr:molybdenum ABC transporter ATP-binding protein [Hoeflea sp.]MBU4528790.1 molybdenum ABC transporter ATP-binding protein [Alphaproteobacteria bacterium]MBU4545883.1 molybdenum ABC transporter ATP-binding protein [Alphaproteobacteria bacterium]MBU4549924.1 molybdenum ABC transporter ATP-binding protein [Alphaproteobacteria bacterium]MBV1725921.1 molybdenum ABC transporter ATP-binding protein [Hoeflea sp.]MBV1762646.1 molybdenum ABC transporter ATP-binding protein [Hoeflea sp.]